jgi:PAS domain S-box-containing protein
VASAIRARVSSGPDRVGWAVLAVAAAITAVLDVCWALVDRAPGEMASPHWLEVPYLLSYPLFIVAIGLLTSPLWRGSDRLWLFDGSALLAVSAGLLWHFVLPHTSDGGRWDTILGFSYLLIDLAFFGTILSAVYRAKLTVRNSLLLIAGTTLAVGDFLYYFQPLAYDSSWTIGLWLVILACATPRERTLVVPPLRLARSQFVPYTFVASMGVITAIELRRGEADDLLLASVAGLVLVAGRQLISLRQALYLQRQETAFREAVLETQSELGLAMLILQDNRVIFANGAAERITGMSATELKLLPAIDVLAFAVDRDQWDEWLADPSITEEARIARPDGLVVDVEVTARWLNAPGDRRLLLVARDVTARREAELAVAQAQKLEGLGALAGGVAHDFNNLLSTVIGNVGLLQLGELDDEARETVDHISSAARRGADLTRSLLDFARAQPQQFKVEDLRFSLNEAATLARRALPVNVSLAVTIGSEPAPVRANHGQLVQAFLNLMLNARDAVGDEGLIAVSMRNADGDAVVDVTDNGSGMDEVTQTRIFEPFFTTKTAGAGTGLGLAISQRTVRDHRGTVSVSSKQGHGTTFTVRIPLAVIARAS